VKPTLRPDLIFAALLGAAVVCAVCAAHALVRGGHPRPLIPSAVVYINLGDDGLAHGSGFYIGRGLVVTAAHVAAASETISVVNEDGIGVDAIVLWISENYDLALLKVSDLRAGIAKLACDYVPKAGDKIEAVGHPVDLKFIHTWGRVAGPVIPHPPKLALLPIDGTFLPGMSGGPLFGSDGRVVGIVDAVLTFGTAPSGVGLAIPVSALCEMMGR
jgi:S1-C subfamily serine protease